MSRATTNRESVTTPRATSGGVNPLVLNKCSHLQDLATQALVRLAREARCDLVPEGDVLFGQGEHADSVYMLLDGAIELDRFDKTGIHSSYEVLAPYATFGDVVLLGERARRYTAKATVDSIVVELPLEPLVEVLSANQPQAKAWRGAVMARLFRKEPHDTANFGWRILDKLSELFAAA